jgi:hypothetical protein
MKLKIKKKKEYSCLALVGHTCNSSYSGGRDQEDCSWKPAQEIVPRPYLEKSLHKNKDCEVAQGVGTEFKNQHPSQPSKQEYKMKSKNLQALILIHLGSSLKLSNLIHSFLHPSRDILWVCVCLHAYMFTYTSIYKYIYTYTQVFKIVSEYM